MNIIPKHKKFNGINIKVCIHGIDVKTRSEDDLYAPIM